MVGILFAVPYPIIRPGIHYQIARLRYVGVILDPAPQGLIELDEFSTAALHRHNLCEALKDSRCGHSGGAPIVRITDPVAPWPGLMAVVGVDNGTVSGVALPGTYPLLEPGHHPVTDLDLFHF